jgi:uncharacterized protein (TIGR03032 family)
MREPSRRTRGAQWFEQDRRWRDSAQIISQWGEATAIDPGLLRWRASGEWWEILAASGLTLLVTREYEHLVLALGTAAGDPAISYLQIPHPSGLAVDAARGVVHVASTRNPNQVYDLAPVSALLQRSDVRAEPLDSRPLVPIRSRFYPGCLYLHDLALIGGALHANAVGQNAVVRLDADGRYARVWWPRCIDVDTGPVFDRNHLQLNSIAAGADLATSYFTASTDTLGTRRPGHRNFAVDRRGVIFSGRTREVIARGLTRPHSARLHASRLWVDNSGYGELGIVEPGRFEPVVRLPGWTRGLFFHKSIAFVGTSHVIPRFRQYAPGLAVDQSVCGVHAVDTRSGRLLGSLVWPRGNQIFAVAGIPSELGTGLPFRAGTGRATRRERTLFYAFAAAVAPDGRS